MARKRNESEIESIGACEWSARAPVSDGYLALPQCAACIKHGHGIAWQMNPGAGRRMWTASGVVVVCLVTSGWPKRLSDCSHAYRYFIWRAVWHFFACRCHWRRRWTRTPSVRPTRMCAPISQTLSGRCSSSMVRKLLSTSVASASRSSASSSGTRSGPSATFGSRWATRCPSARSSFSSPGSGRRLASYSAPKCPPTRRSSRMC